MYKQHLNLYLPKEDLHVMVKKAGGQTGITASQFAQYLACMAGARKGKGDQLRAMPGGGGGQKRLQLSHCLFRLSRWFIFNYASIIAWYDLLIGRDVLEAI